MALSTYNKALELWNSFRDEVMYQRRFFPSHPVLDLLVPIAQKSNLMVSPGTVFYRARIIDETAARKDHMVAKYYGPDSTEEDHKWYRDNANKFRGLNKEGSYVPTDPSVIKDGRSNPKLIRYLYVAESPTTAVFEVRPILYSAINVSGIEVKEPLSLANIAVDIDPTPDQEKSIDEWLLCFLQSAFSYPTSNTDDYIPSQIIAEFFRHLGYDGIRYSSSLHRGGYNLTIYDTSKCEPVFSTELRLEDIKISLRPAIGAGNIDERFEYILDNVPMRVDKETKRLVEVDV